MLLQGKRFEQLNDIIEKYLVKASEHFVPSAHARKCGMKMIKGTVRC